MIVEVMVKSGKTEELSDLIVDKLPKVPLNVVSMANALGFTLAELKEAGFPVDEDLL